MLFLAGFVRLNYCNLFGFFPFKLMKICVVVKKYELVLTVGRIFFSEMNWLYTLVKTLR